MNTVARITSNEGIPVAAVNFVLRTAESIGFAIDAKAKLSGQTNHRQSFLARDRFSPTFQDCMAALTPHIFAWESMAKPPSFKDCELLCACVINCRTLEEAILQTIYFLDALNERSGRLTLTHKANTAHLTIITLRNNKGVADLLIDMYGIYFYYNFFSWLIDEPLAALPNKVKLTHRVEGLFRRSSAQQAKLPTKEHIGYLLGHSGSKLNRHLAQENTTFQELSEKYRMQRALELLRSTERTIESISYGQGFNSPGSFSRAFKDWTGHSPATLRCALIHENLKLAR